MIIVMSCLKPVFDAVMITIPMVTIDDGDLQNFHPIPSREPDRNLDAVYLYIDEKHQRTIWEDKLTNYKLRYKVSWKG